MRIVLRYLIEYQRKHFDLKLYLSIAAFLAASMAFNYALDFEDSYVDESFKKPWHFLVMFAWQGFPFLVVCGLLWVFNINRKWVTSRAFWISFLIGFFLLGFDRAFHYHTYLKGVLDGIDYYFLRKCVSWSSSLFTVVLPLIFLSKYLEPDHPDHYWGLAIRRFDFKPYLQLLAIAIVIIGIGSFFGDIQEYYPRYLHAKGNLFASHNDWPNWASLALYEFCYASDFLAVEITFRGFLIYAFTRILGGYAVLPMVATYCYLHFGKPWPEAFSSIFGGYILGVISLRTDKIWGGVIIHIGIAWAMELFGYLQRLI